MTRAEAFDKAWRIAIKENVFSLVDKIYHLDYQAFDAYAEVEVNLEAEKSGIETFGEFLIVTNSTVLIEGDNFLKINRYNRHTDAKFASLTTSITYKYRLIITQRSEAKELHDPS